MSPDDAARGPDALAARFLGRHAAAGGPFALLGVGHDTRDAASIRAAAARRLAQIDRHPLRLTPEAEEMRLAVHAAAAQLSDPSLHAELVRHWPPGEPEPAPAAWRSRLSPVSQQLVRHARMVIGASGGWNPRAKRRLAHVARLHRVNARDLIRAIRPTGAGTRRAPEKGGFEPVEIEGPRSTGALWLGVHAGLLGLLALIAALTVARLTAPPAVRTSATPPPPAPAAQPPATPPTRERIEHHAALEQELRNAVARIDADPRDGVARGARAVATFLERWQEMPPDARERIAALSAVVWSAPGGGAKLEQTLGEAVAAGPAARAGAEAMRERLRGSETGFDDLAVASLDAQADAGVGWGLDAWKAWSGALGACEGASTTARARSRMRALGMLLRAEGPTPEWRAIALELASGLSWRPGEPARGWLLAEIADAAVRTDRLAGLTEAVATGVSAPGVDASMVLAPNVNPAARAALADRYRLAWAAPEGGLRSDLLAALADATASQAGLDEHAAMLALVRLAAVNAACAAFDAGDEARARALLDAPEPEFTPARSRPLTEAFDDAWGARLIGAGDAEALEMLRGSFSTRGGFSPLAAEALVQAAQSATNTEVRQAARAVVATSGADAQVLLALDRAATRRPSAVVGEMVSAITGVALPSRRDGEWLMAVRAALLPRIAELLASDRPGVEGLASLRLAELAAGRAGVGPATPHLRSLAIEAGSRLSVNPLPAADPLSEASIRARLAGRTVGASGTHAVTAYHRAIVECIAADAAARMARPRSGPEATLERLGEAWSSAETVIDRLLATHRAEAELWRWMLEGAL